MCMYVTMKLTAHITSNDRSRYMCIYAVYILSVPKPYKNILTFVRAECVVEERRPGLLYNCMMVSFSMALLMPSSVIVGWDAALAGVLLVGSFGGSMGDFFT